MQQAVNMVAAGVLHDVVDDTDPDILLVLCADMNSMIHDEHYIVTNGLFCQSD
jgi:HD superfamily phosphohydrolase YqeK